MGAARETYVTARARLLTELASLGWETRPSLKFPWAKKDSTRVNFKAQAVYLVSSLSGEEHSLFLDIRGLAVGTFVATVVRVQASRNDSGVF